MAQADIGLDDRPEKRTGRHPRTLAGAGEPRADSRRGPETTPGAQLFEPQARSSRQDRRDCPRRWRQASAGCRRYWPPERRPGCARGETAQQPLALDKAFEKTRRSEASISSIAARAPSARAHFVGLAGDPDEGAAGLFAGDILGNLLPDRAGFRRDSRFERRAQTGCEDPEMREQDPAVPACRGLADHVEHVPLGAGDLGKLDDGARMHFLVEIDEAAISADCAAHLTLNPWASIRSRSASNCCVQ